MKLSKRPIAVATLTLAFLCGAWGNVIAAAFCARLSDQSCCPEHSETSTSPEDAHQAHHQMDEASADMSSMSEGSSCTAHEPGAAETNDTEQSANELAESSDSREPAPFVVSLLGSAACTHCLNHSQPAPTRFSLSGGESSRNHDVAAALVIKLQLALPSFAKLLPGYDHGPPGQSHRLFVLNSVFRI